MTAVVAALLLLNVLPARAQTADRADTDTLLQLPAKAAQLIAKNEVRAAVEIVSAITRERVNQVSRRADRLILFVTRARVFSHAQRYRESLQSYSDAIRNGLADGEAGVLELEGSAVSGEVLACARRALSIPNQSASGDLIQLGVALEEIDRGVLGHQFLAQLMFAERSPEAVAQVEEAWLRVFAVSPPSPAQFADRHAAAITKGCESAPKLLVCDVRKAYEGSLSFPNASQLKKPPGFPLFPSSSRTSPVDDEVLLGDFCAFLVRLARFRILDRQTSPAADLLLESWTLNGNVGAAFLLSALLVGNPELAEKFAAARASLADAFSPRRIRRQLDLYSDLWPELTEFFPGFDDPLQISQVEAVVQIHANLDYQSVQPSLKLAAPALQWARYYPIPNGLHSLASVLTKSSPALAARLYAAAAGQNLFLGSPADARRSAAALAAMRGPEVAAPWAFEGQAILMGAALAGSSIRARSEAGEVVCPVGADNVFECTFRQPFRRRQRIVIDGAGSSSEVEVFAALRANVLLAPRHGDRFVEGFPRPGTTRIDVSVSPPACAPGQPVWRETVLLAPHERFFSVPVRRRLNAGETVTVEEQGRKPTTLPVTDSGESILGRMRIYTRFGAELLPNGSLSQTGELRPRNALSLAVSPDFALVTHRVAHPACAPRLRDYISVHAFADVRYESVTTTARLPESLTTLRGSTRSGPVVEGGIYVPLPIPRGQWRQGGRAFSTIFAPMLKGGFHARQGDSDDIDGREAVRRGPYPFVAAGARIAVFRYSNYVKGRPGSVEKMFFHADFLRGRWTNFSVPTATGYRLPWRWEARFNASLPFSPFFVGGFVNLGRPGPDDFRLFVGYRLEISKGGLWPARR